MREAWDAWLLAIASGRMYRISKDFTFSAAHAIRGHTRGCQNLHGHNYRVRIELAAATLDALGMVLDFSDLKAMAAEILSPFDHHVINDVAPFDERNTTAELLAEYVFEEMVRRLPERVVVTQVEVWENDASRAIFSRE